jgi:hypothetical protein
VRSKGVVTTVKESLTGILVESWAKGPNDDEDDDNGIGTDVEERGVPKPDGDDD